ncbi:MAG: hypothetical protein JXM79_17985 [Sedimentisphaerales bacterium]|nr:hypothetical protein [Sedimentisphaerales bacterium]
MHYQTLYPIRYWLTTGLVMLLLINAVVFAGIAKDAPKALKSSTSELAVKVGKDEQGHWWAELENSVIYCRYGWKPINEDQGGESFITDFTIKKIQQNQVGPRNDTGRIDACAARYQLIDARVVRDSQEYKTVRLKWHHKQKGFTPVQDVTIFPDKPYLRIDYTTYGVNIVDIARQGGDENANYWFYGGDQWKRDYVLYPKGYFYPPDDTYVVEQTGMPGDETPGSLSYKGHFIMAVFNEKTGVGYGRVSPVHATSIIKLLFNRGFELFPYWRKPKQPYNGYLFAITGGAAEAERIGKQIVDEIKKKEKGS